MLNFLKAGAEYNKLAKSMNGMNIMIQDLIPKIERSYNYSEFEGDILFIAYVARKGVLDRMEQYNWSMDAKIVVPTINKGLITLMYAFTQTVGNLQIIAEQLELSKLVEEVMDKGKAYYELERNLPSDIIKTI